MIQAARDRSWARGLFAVVRRRWGGSRRGGGGPDSVLVQDGVDIRMTASEILQPGDERADYRPLHRLKLLRHFLRGIQFLAQNSVLIIEEGIDAKTQQQQGHRGRAEQGP